MKNIFEEAFQIQKLLEQNTIDFCFIGGVAVQRWGELRTTNDVDVTILSAFGDEATYVNLLLESYESRIDNPLEFVSQARVLLLKTKAGIGIDVAFGALPFEQKSIQRATFSEFLPNISLKTCSAEDLIIYKTFAARPKDWLDIEGIILRQKALDWNYIEEQLIPLLDLKEEPEHFERLKKIRNLLAK
jgi:hypothetical protein